MDITEERNTIHRKIATQLFPERSGQKLNLTSSSMAQSQRLKLSEVEHQAEMKIVSPRQR
uniref:Ethylene-responsive transcription factor RAP2-7 isoform X3 n=1 Tax=Rhizophora mucronata TaxID=61149 RepID=A0A2P2IRS0_RHIMU